MSEPEGWTASDDVVREQVRARYGRIAREGGCCGPAVSDRGPGSCCGPTVSGRDSDGDRGSTGTRDGSPLLQIGYPPEELAHIPDGANLGLGCGNPTGLLSLGTGDVVLDLGSGAGIDCFLAAERVGPSGRVIGVDMTPDMVARARANARRSSLRNVEFRLGEIEHLPIADHSVDVVLSNCVINLVPDKAAVYREAFRVLRPGGRLAVADVVATRPITPAERNDPALWCSCSSGASRPDEIRGMLAAAGFAEIDISVKAAESPAAQLEPQARLGVCSADIRARRPN